MKNFKQFINEFRILNPRDPNGLGGEDPHEELARIADSIPFVHRTNEEDEFKFGSTLNAAKVAAVSRTLHEMGLSHARDTVRKPHMTEYFLASTGTHDDLLDHITDHLYHHASVPARLKPHVESFIESIAETQGSKTRSKEEISRTAGAAFGQDGGFGEYVYRKNYSDPVGNNQHPHLMNDTHHLQDVIEEAKADPDGYFMTSQERLDQ